ncbi:MAG: hypothetical protein N3D11_17705, partial [Candidatus Sumerlaeia bacterium]|nr:hypothetical protein [Candidatus Sumerlaeia bacterium]
MVPKRLKKYLWVGGTWVGIVMICLSAIPVKKHTAAAVRSPYDLAYSPDGKTLAVSDRTAGRVVLMEPTSGKVVREIPLEGEPTGLVWSSDGQSLYVSEHHAAAVVEIHCAKGNVARRLGVGARPIGLALAPKKGLLLAANWGIHSVSVVSLADGRERARIPTPREPFAIAVTPDESRAVVTNLLPAMSATDPEVAAEVSLIDLEKLAVSATVPLPVGSANVREVALSSDGRWAYLVHTLGHFNLPTTQLDRGWINTNALSVLDLSNSQLYATVLLDQVTQGAADPWGVAVSKDGETLWITLAGVHQLAKIHLKNLHRLLAGEKILSDEAEKGGAAVWAKVRQDGRNRDLLAYDLAALYSAGLIERIYLNAKGPRGLDLAPDGGQMAVAAYYEGAIVFADAKTGRPLRSVALEPAREPDLARRGEIAFHDASYCFEHWLSCATCHPEGRVDGLNWDLLNDGIGNPKNTKSLLLSAETPPSMSLGVRATMEVATVAGFRFIQFHEPEPETAEATQAYIRSLKPEKSPYLLPNGKLSKLAEQGKKIFESPKTGCTVCHAGPLFTDLKMYDVGTADGMDKGKAFDTPTLIELWRTAPYLHTG